MYYNSKIVELNSQYSVFAEKYDTYGQVEIEYIFEVIMRKI